MFTLAHTAKSYPKLPYEEMKNRVLGTRYDLSLVFVGARRAQELNMVHRNATYVPNVLSFPLGKTEGEIYITPTVAKRQAKRWNMTYRGYVGLLFIHGLLHLKGHPHGATMEKAERVFISEFGLK